MAGYEYRIAVLLWRAMTASKEMSFALDWTVLPVLRSYKLTCEVVLTADLVMAPRYSPCFSKLDRYSFCHVLPVALLQQSPHTGSGA
jgi:hypothetical protein